MERKTSASLNETCFLHSARIPEYYVAIKNFGSFHKIFDFLNAEISECIDMSQFSEISFLGLI